MAGRYMPNSYSRTVQQICQCYRHNTARKAYVAIHIGRRKAIQDAWLPDMCAATAL